MPTTVGDCELGATELVGKIARLTCQPERRCWACSSGRRSSDRQRSRPERHRRVTLQPQLAFTPRPRMGLPTWHDVEARRPAARGPAGALTPVAHGPDYPFQDLAREVAGTSRCRRVCDYLPQARPDRVLARTNYNALVSFPLLGRGICHVADEAPRSGLSPAPSSTATSYRITAGWRATTPAA
jgi:hypothetical protein